MIDPKILRGIMENLVSQNNNRGALSQILEVLPITLLQEFLNMRGQVGPLNGFLNLILYASLDYYLYLVIILKNYSLKVFLS
jgi:hypothetical protein